MSGRIITYPVSRTPIQHAMAVSFARALLDQSKISCVTVSGHVAGRVLYPSVVKGFDRGMYSLLSNQSVADAVYENAMRYLDSVIQAENAP